MLEKIRKYRIDHLRPEQRIRYEEVKWLLDDINNRQTGRSYLMALAFIEIAAENPGKWIRCFDHYGNFVSNRYMIETIVSVFKDLSIKDSQLQVTRDNLIKISKV